MSATAVSSLKYPIGQSLADGASDREKFAALNMETPSPSPEHTDSDSHHDGSDVSTASDERGQPIKCSAIHTLERDMPDFDYSHLVADLRAKILKHCDENPGLFSQLDYDKCKTDDWHLSRFLLRQKLDVDAAHEMLKKTLRAKHESLLNTMRAEDFPAEFYQIGGLFGYESDRKGNKMLYIRVKVHRKIPELQAVLQAFLWYNIQHLDEQANGRGIALVFDCTGGGLANADMDLLMFIVSTLVNYFPKGFSYILVHELPWILKPFWYIARAWVSEDHRQLIKFSNSRTIYEYVDRENLPDFMGGTCKRDYRAPPPDCTSLIQAAKLWGVEPEIVKRVMAKFAEHLPAGAYERAIELCNESIRNRCAENQVDIN